MNFKSIILICCLVVPLPSFSNNGDYTGSSTGKRGKITVQVTLVDSVISAIKVTESKEDKVFVYPRMTKTILANNNINIDIISGASLTSKGFLAAIENALKPTGINFKGEPLKALK